MFIFDLLRSPMGSNINVYTVMKIAIMLTDIIIMTNYQPFRIWEMVQKNEGSK